MPHLSHAVSGPSRLALTLCIVLTAIVYLRGWLRLRSTSVNAIAGWRACSFLVGMLLIWAAVASPIGAFDHEMLTIHMVQHVLLMTLAPPLIWLGEPLMAGIQGLPRQFVQSVINPMLAWTAVRRFGKTLAQPAFCWLAAAAALVVWHVPAIFNLALQTKAWHVVEYVSFFATGLLFWWPVVSPWPAASRLPDFSIILYLFLATLPCDILSGLLVFCDRVVYPAYFSASRPFGFSPIEDQQCAGALMWTCVTVVFLIAGTILTTRLLAPRNSMEPESAQPNCHACPTPQGVQQSPEAL